MEQVAQRKKMLIKILIETAFQMPPMKKMKTKKKKMWK